MPTQTTQTLTPLQRQQLVAELAQDLDAAHNRAQLLETAALDVFHLTNLHALILGLERASLKLRTLRTTPYVIHMSHGKHARSNP